MKELKEKILKEGVAIGTQIVKVDHFLNHRLDIRFLDKIGAEFRRRFDGETVDKILTVEASGIAVACSVARAFGNIPVLFAKKHTSAALSDDVYYSTVWSHTNSCNYNIVISREYLSSDDKILLVDDFLANGNAMKGLIEIAENAGAKVQGICVAIEKAFQSGGDALREKGIQVESGAIIEKMSYNGDIIFRS